MTFRCQVCGVVWTRHPYPRPVGQRSGEQAHMLGSAVPKCPRWPCPTCLAASKREES